MKQTVTDKGVNAFLSSGILNGFGPEEMAAACDRQVRSLTQVSSDKAVAQGRQFVKQSQKHGGILLRTAQRSLGWACLVAGQYNEARKTYLKARKLLKHDAVLQARIDRVLIDVYMYLGKFGEAQKRAHNALAAFKKAKADDDIAKTKVNYANLLHRQDRHREAQKLYREAGDFFESRGIDLAAALCFYNQGNTHVQLFDFAGAGSLYRKARKIFEKHDQRLHAYGCLYGLAWLHMLEGNFHTALQELNECEIEYRRGRHTRELVLCLLDRAEVYLGLNLFIDARNTAKEAFKGARRLGINYEEAKGLFFYGKALFGLGQAKPARKALTEAEICFNKGKNAGFQAAVKMTRALAANGDFNIAHMRTARKLFYKAQLPLWEAICDLQIVTRQPDDNPALQRLTKNPATKTVPHIRAQYYTVLGDRQARQNRMKPAIDYWSRAANILDGVRAKLPPVELRSSFFTQHSDPYRKLIKAEYKDNPDRAAVWSEKYKTAGLWSASDDFYTANPARKKVETSLSELARQVTAVSQKISEPGDERAMAINQAGKSFSDIKRRVRDNLLTMEKPDHPGEHHDENLIKYFREASARQAIVQFHVGRSDIIAVVHYRGDCHAHLYRDGVAVLSELVARWRFFVEFAQTVRENPRPVDLDDEQQLLEHIGAWLLPPLNLPHGARRLLILPEGRISSLPWQAIKTGGKYLSEKYEIVFAPSLRHHRHAHRSRVKSRKIKLFVGASSGLTYLREEIAAVSEQLTGPVTDIYDPCRRADWPNNSRARVWHFSGHAHLRADNPFYSSLLLEDGPLFAADFRLKKNNVELITLAACRTGQQTGLPGEEASGLVRSLLEMGARNIIASHWAVADQSASLWMKLFYTYYLDGSSIGKAIRLAARGVREKYPSAYHWGAFSVFGAG